MADEQALTPETEKRRAWMAVLAKARPAEVEQAWERLSRRPQYSLLRKPETGMVMVRGRAGGTGSAFNLGEMTVTRSAVQLESGTTGHAYVAGRSPRHAELAAVFDAMLQDQRSTAELHALVIAPLAEAQAQRRHAAALKAASTKVDFFTLVRGES